MNIPARVTPIDLYEPKLKPYDHQLEALKKSCFLEYFAYLMDMGTGKSKVIIDNFSILFENRKINTVLLLAPKSVYRNWIIREIPKHLPDRILQTTRIWVHGIRKVEKLQAAVFQENGFNLDLYATKESLVELLDGDYRLNILVANTEAFSVEGKSRSILMEALTMFMRASPTYFVIDESTTIRSSKSSRTKSILKLRDSAKFRRIATGLLTPNGPENAYAQFEFLKAGCLGFSSPVAFKARYCKTIPISMGMYSINKTTGVRNLDELKGRIAKHSYRVTKEECLDLPGKTYEFIDSDLDELSREFYTSMKKHAFIELQHDSGESMFVQTQNRINMLMRLQRITCGHIQDTEGNIQRFSSKRIEDTVEYLSFIKGSVLIWSVFTKDVVDLVAAIQKEYGKSSCRAYYGSTTTGERDEAVTLFQKKELPYLVLNQATGRFGNTLTAASTAIYYSNSPDLEFRNQSEERIYRIGQNDHCLYFDLLAPETVNYGMVTCLRKKINLSGEVMGDRFKDWLV